MSTFFWFTYASLWFLTVVMIGLVLLLFRQFGLTSMRGSHRIALGGLDVGSKAPTLTLEDPAEKALTTYSWESTGPPTVDVGWFALFALSGCPICGDLWESGDLGVLPQEWPQIRFVWIDQTERLGTPAPPGWSLRLSTDRAAYEAMAIPAAPFAYAIWRGGEVAIKGLVNTREDITLFLERSFGARGARGGPAVGRIELAAGGSRD